MNRRHFLSLLPLIPVAARAAVKSYTPPPDLEAYCNDWPSVNEFMEAVADGSMNFIRFNQLTLCFEFYTSADGAALGGDYKMYPMEKGWHRFLTLEAATILTHAKGVSTVWLDIRRAVDRDYLCMYFGIDGVPRDTLVRWKAPTNHPYDWVTA